MKKLTYDAGDNVITAMDENGVIVTNTYDALDRLRTRTFPDGGGSSTATDFIYDGLGRLRKRIEYTWSSGWSPVSTTYYVYDGMLVVQERTSSPTVTYTRGPDLSGSLQGAGGIGGLLSRSHGYSSGAWSTHNHYHADGGGNVTFMINSSQNMVATYKYEPFGKTISQAGTLATANVYRFSSKEAHVDSGMYYYGYRWYEADLQRWMSRDPLMEDGGINIYTFVLNNGISFFDPFGEVCGSKEDGRNSEIIPDKPGGFDFTAACQAHDNCYGDCNNGKSRGQCDEEFLDKMYQYCKGLKNPIKVKPCKDWADLYYNGVRKYGRNAWTHSRAKCNCG